MTPVALEPKFNGSQLKAGVSREKLTVYMTSTLSSRTFLLNIWFLPVFVFFVIVVRHIVISY